MTDNRKIRVGISIGDINGVGIELILKTFEDKRMLEMVTPVVYGSDKVVSYYKKVLKIPVQTFTAHGVDKISDGKINIIKVWNEDVEVKPGVPTKISGQKAFESFKASTQALKEGAIDYLLTCPISKDNIQSEDFKFPGHTEYLANQFEGKNLMMLISDEIRVGLVTNHIPVSEISQTLNKEVIQEKVNLMYQSLIKDFGIDKPKIAVLGVNPHCGDHGVIGNEDDELLRPILEEYQQEGKLVYGPYAADGFFGNQSYRNFDGVLAMYHDQGLVGFKALSFGNGVNFTAGLEKVRVSPDHGTAFDIAGKSLADISSFKEALFKGVSIFRQREEFGKLTENALKIKNKREELNKK